jgi:hypothetical protein
MTIKPFFMQSNQPIPRLRLLLLCCLTVCCLNQARAQNDSLVLINGDIIVGTINSMDKGVVNVETDYSKNNFTIKWSGIKEVYSKTIFLVTLANGNKINGALQSTGEPGKITITEPTGQKTEVPLNDIVYLKGLKSDFWSRVKASVDAGLSFSKANNLQQITVNSSIGYTADKWVLDLYYTMVKSSQDNVATTKRFDAGAGYKYSLPKDWFLAASATFLSNTEQALKLRSIGKLGVGNYIIHTNASYWAISGGLSYNNESFTNDTEGRNSLEAYAGSELNLFDVGDLSLFNSVYVYPSLTESGRWRTDFKIDLKYDLPLDFYIKSGLTLNYDNKPAVAGKETDYVLFFTLGWQL